MYTEILEDVCTYAQRSSTYPWGLELSFQVLAPLPVRVCPEERTQRSIVRRGFDWWLDDVCGAGSESRVGGVEVGGLGTEGSGRKMWRQRRVEETRWGSATLTGFRVTSWETAVHCCLRTRWWMEESEIMWERETRPRGQRVRGQNYGGAVGVEGLGEGGRWESERCK